MEITEEPTRGELWSGKKKRKMVWNSITEKNNTAIGYHNSHHPTEESDLEPNLAKEKSAGRFIPPTD